MKSIMNLVVFAFSILFVLQPSNAIAQDASGSAVIPYIQSATDTGSYTTNIDISTSNITSNPVTVTITLYDQDGNIITDTVDSSSGAGILRLCTASASVTNWTDNDAGPGYSATYVLGGHKTVRLRVITGTSKIGYGRIQWYQSNSDAVHSLTAHAKVWVYYDLGTKSSNSIDSISINGDMPF